jgi:hypothetical protein
VARTFVAVIVAAAVAISGPAGAPDAATVSPAPPAAISGGEIHSAYPSSGVSNDIPNRYRNPACASSKSYRFVAVYARPYDRADGYWGAVGQIRAAVARGNSFVHDEAARAGLPRLDLRFGCTSGQVTVLNAVLRTSAYRDSFQTIEYDLMQAGLRDPRVKYWVWYDDSVGNGACGEARKSGDASLAEDNRANHGPDYAVAYATITACGSVASTLLHEATHTMGGVSHTAWGTDRSGHCVDGRDVMCTSGNLCPYTAYDCGKDTYFDPRPRGGEYLYTHWNIAFCVNRYISRVGCTTAPRNLKASHVGYAITLRWNAPSSTGGAPLARYEIYRRSCGDCPFNLLDEIAGTRTSYTDFGIETVMGNRFEYQLRAVNVWADGGPLSGIAGAGFWG